MRKAELLCSVSLEKSDTLELCSGSDNKAMAWSVRDGMLGSRSLDVAWGTA